MTNCIQNLLASIRNKPVKRRVYKILSNLSSDHWLQSNLENYKKQLNTEEQWFDSISFLNWYAHNFKPKNYLEVGVRRGRSIAQVLVESPETNAYGFDLWIPDYASIPQQGIYTSNPGPEFVLAELKKLGVENLPTLIRGDSHETLPSFFDNSNNPQEFDLIFIDGDHTYTGAKIDLDIAFEHLAPGGALLFDDIYHRSHLYLSKLWDTYKNKFDDYLFIEDVSGNGAGVAFKPPYTQLEYHLNKKITIPNRKNNNKSTEQLPVHFFTIVLNGEPFIRYHIDIFNQLPFPWHWHIIEGVADLKHDTAWVLAHGGHIVEEIHDKGYSNDGTTEYLDELAQQYPEQVTIYRKPEGVFWDGKREMVNAPLANIQEECLLWQVDADELWTVEQICTARQMFIDNPGKTAAFYWCWYFVGENLLISTRNCYAQNPQQEWLRTWRYKPGAIWASHSPPCLVEPLANGKWIDLAQVNPLSHEETEKEGLVFQHFAYATPTQLKFKEQYYGYQNAVAKWKALQEQTRFPVLLRQYFPWVQDTTQVERAESVGVVPIAKREDGRSNWQFIQPEELPSQSLKIEKTSPIIIVDGVFFQLFKTGIARVWKSLLEEWADNGFAKHIIVLDRAGTAPEIPGIRYQAVPPYDYYKTHTDRGILQQICDQEGADLFISTYYTTPISTPSVFMAYDMIPEVMGWNLNHPMWQEKHYAIRYASAYIAISENTARDLVEFFPDISPESVTVAPCGVKNPFLPATVEEVNGFTTKYGISKPYFLIVGASGTGSYKNSILFFQAFAQLYSKQGFDIVVTGSGSLLDPELRAYTSGSVVHMLQLSEQELRAAYSGAVALVYPSKYEGFGLPILEAMACGCPVITCANASIPEVAGEAVLYVHDDKVNELANALCDVQKPTVRHSLVAAGFEQAKKFSWSTMANHVSSVLVDATLLPFNLKDINLIIFPDWSQPEESLGIDLQKAVKAVAMHPNSSYMTLLIDISSIFEEEATMLLSAVVMNLLMEEDLDVSEGLEISLVGKLSESQWQALLAHIDARLMLEHENQQAIAQAKAETLQSYEVDGFSDGQVSSFFLS